MPDININELILNELRDTRKEMNEGFTELRQRSTALETNVIPFFQTDGDLDKIQNDIKELNKSKWIVLGGAGALSGLLHTLLKKLGI
jgi:uncharacterized coiled-coil DUF342 family protein